MSMSINNESIYDKENNKIIGGNITDMAILNFVKEHYRNERINDRDGVKIDFADGWVHLRKSNTEPIIRIYSEAATMERANALAEQVKQLVN